jgi:transcriptional regulator of arginine metabolism
MKNKKNRLQLISKLLRANVVGSQDDLLQMLKAQNCEVTQATLSRDLRQLKVMKTSLSNGGYKYILPVQAKTLLAEGNSSKNSGLKGIVNVEFSGQLAVIKTRMGFAGAIAWDIDKAANKSILGTLAGDDTLLVIPRDGFTRYDILDMLNQIFGHKK